MQTCFNSFEAVSTNFGAIEAVLKTARRALAYSNQKNTRSATKHAFSAASTRRVPGRAKAHPQNKSEYLSRNPYKSELEKKSCFFIFRILR